MDKIDLCIVQSHLSHMVGEFLQMFLPLLSPEPPGPCRDADSMPGHPARSSRQTPSGSMRSNQGYKRSPARLNNYIVPMTCKHIHNMIVAAT